MKLGILDRLRGRVTEADSDPDLDAILARSLQPERVGETYPDDAGNRSALVTESSQRLLRNSHVFSDLWFRTNSLTAEDTEIVTAFLQDLAAVVRTRGVMLTADVIDHLCEMLERRETSVAHWQEPWMVPYKIPRQRAVDLFEHCLAQATASLPFERLSEAGLKAKWAKNYGELADRLRSDSMEGSPLMKVFHTTLVRVARQDDRSDIRSLCYTLDYALACMGDRTAMMRVAETLRRVCVPEGDDDESLLLTDARCKELALVSDSWRRLSSIVRTRPMGDGERELAEIIAPAWIDMRFLDAAFEDKPGWVLPPSNAVQIQFSPIQAENWRVTLFRPAIVRPEPMPHRTDEDSVNIKASAMLFEMFADEDCRKILKRMADEDANRPIDDGDLESIRRCMIQVRDAKRPLNTVEVVAASFGRLVQERQSVTDYLTALAAPPKPLTPAPTMNILDRIGPSEEPARGSPENTFARLLQPFELRPPKQEADRVFKILSSEFPWMREANEFVARAIAISARRPHNAFKLKPLLLAGAPGIGKTRWVRRISELTGVESHTISLAGANSTKAIVGSERGWASARPSLPAYSFMATGIANPIIYVDEVDKSAAWDEVADGFLPMIEKETSGRYPDSYLLGNLNLDAASFLFSANDISKVSAAFLSRVELITVRAPTENEIKPVIAAMVEEVGREAMLDMFEVADLQQQLLAESVSIYMKNTNLRLVRRHVEQVVGRVVWHPPGPRLVT